VASEHLTRPDDVPPGQIGDDPRPGPAGPDLTPAEQHALRRSAPLSPDKFEELGRLAARGINPLRKL
jgi:hypothetical protein